MAVHSESRQIAGYTFHVSIPLITDTFVLVAPDSARAAAALPAVKAGKDTIAVIQHELLSAQPYTYTLEHLIFATHLRRHDLTEDTAASQVDAIGALLFAKPYACMRASPLPKQFGWGVHYDHAGRLAIYPVESQEYARFAAGDVPGVTVVAAMRAKRAG